jgi:hypothetical protein
MVRPFGAQSHARAVGQPEPAFFRLLGWNFKPLAPPDAFHPLVVDDPTRRASKQLRDLTIAVTAILAGKLDNVGGQPFLVIPPHGDATLRGTVLPERAANPPFGQLQFGSDVVDAGAAARGA